MSGRRQDWPRFSRKEIRDFANELDRDGWSYDGIDADGHTIWTHPRATGRFKLPSTPRHFSVRLARRDVQRLLGRKPTGKRRGGTKPKGPSRDFALQQIQKEAREQRRPSVVNPVPVTVAITTQVMRIPKRLPWEDQPDDYDRGLDRLMRERPHR